MLVVIVGAVYAFTRIQASRQAGATGEFQTEPAQRGSLVASVGATGSVRANQSAVLTWQTSGTVEEVNVEVNDLVELDQTLASLSKTSLAQNVILAEAEFVSAQKALDDLLNSSLPQAQALQTVEEAQKALDDLQVNTDLLRAQTQLTLVNSQEALEDAEYGRTKLNYDRASQAAVDAAEANYILAQNEVDRLQKEFNKFSGRPEDDPVRALALSNLAAAKQKRDSVLRQLNWYKGNPGEDEISEADANLALAEAQVLEAQTEWERALDGPTDAEVAVLESQLVDAEREFERIQDGPDPADIAAAEARVAAAQSTRDLARISAPFAGTITQAQTKVGDQVAPGTIAFRLDDLSHLLVDVEVSEVDINRIRVGQPVSLIFDAILGKEYRGEVVEVGLVGQVNQGAVNFNVTVELLDADEDVRPGMTAAVNMVVDQLEDVLLVPNRAVRVREGKRVVYVFRNGVPEPVEITLGASSETVSEVVDGDLQVGDPIVLNPPSEPTFFGGPPGGPPGS
jgi:HlyD family secretion protein